MVLVNSLSVWMRELRPGETHRLHSEGGASINNMGPDARSRALTSRPWPPTFYLRVAVLEGRHRDSSAQGGVPRMGSQATLGSVPSYASHQPGTLDKEIPL